MLQERSLTSPRMSQASLVWWLDLDCWHRFLWKKHVSEDILNDVIGKGDKKWHVVTYYMWFPQWHMWYIWWSFQVALCGYPRFGWYLYVEKLWFSIFIHTKRSIYLVSYLYIYIYASIQEGDHVLINCKLFLWIVLVISWFWSFYHALWTTSIHIGMLAAFALFSLFSMSCK